MAILRSTNDDAATYMTGKQELLEVLDQLGPQETSGHPGALGEVEAI